MTVESCDRCGGILATMGFKGTEFTTIRCKNCGRLVDVYEYLEPTVRPEIQEFAEALERTALKNEARGKGDEWKTCSIPRLVGGLSEELDEFRSARTVEEAESEALDVGLYAMFLWWRSRYGT